MNALDAWITQVRTRRGATICIRPLRLDDREREVAFLEGLSARSRYLRLFVTRKVLPTGLIDQLMDLDYRRRMAFAATTTAGGMEQLVGVARYATAGEQDVAEFAVSVADAWQRSGVATALLKQLIRYGREQHIRRLQGQILPENVAMIALARRLGFTVTYDPAHNVFICNCELGEATVAA